MSCARSGRKSNAGPFRKLKGGRGGGSKDRGPVPGFPRSCARFIQHRTVVHFLHSLLLLVDVNFFVIVCVVSESSTFSRQCPCIDDRLKSRDNDGGIRDFYIQRGLDDKHLSRASSRSNSVDLTTCSPKRVSFHLGCRFPSTSCRRFCNGKQLPTSCFQ